MTKCAQISIDEQCLVALVAEAVSRRIERDFDTRDDLRTNVQMLRDSIHGIGRADVRRYLLEMLNEPLREPYQITITQDTSHV